MSHDSLPTIHARCCPCGDHHESDVSRRGFLGVAVAASTALSGLSWASLASADDDGDRIARRRPLVVKPILVYETPTRLEKASWRQWGGIETMDQAREEAQRIGRELAALSKKADFPVKFLPLAMVRTEADVKAMTDGKEADAILLYAAGGTSEILELINESGKDTILFVRWNSGPVYFWYEAVSPRFLRQRTDTLKIKGIDSDDVVVDDQDEVLWRLRALCGVHNTRATKILCIGGPSGWGKPNRPVAPKLARNAFNFDMRTVSYNDLAELIKAARADEKAVARAKRRADAYLALPGTTLETDRKFVENGFLLDAIFRAMMNQAECQAITINSCMGTIMEVAETSACITLSTLNDDGYLAFCESDFVVIPSGMLMANISGLPVFLNDPTFPHKGIITLAHCTAPRRMNGKTIEAARILTHFESDYGAAPKVEMAKGQVVTNVIGDFSAKRWIGLKGEIIDAPFRPICRSQIDIKYTADSAKLAACMHGFHWMTGYGDYTREIGYAVKRFGIEWELMG